MPKEEIWREQILQKAGEIDSLEDIVRRHINTTRYQSDLISDSDNWNKICCSLDTIDDTLYAICAYVESKYPENVGLRYIFTYGVLQALFIQQEAIAHLSEAFGIKFKPHDNDKLYQARSLRNAAIGHPTKQNPKHDPRTYYNYISRITLSQSGFTLMRSDDQGKTSFKDIELYPIIRDQLFEIESRYKIISNKLEEADRMHKKKFKEMPLADIFHSAMSYCFQKIAQAIHSQDSNEKSFGLSNLQIIQETYIKFENALKERGDIDTYTQRELDEYNHGLLKLKNYLESSEHDMSEFDARIYHFYASEQHKNFEKIAKEIDQSYK